MPRLDVWLATRGDYPSRARAQGAIRAGKVRVDGQTITKPGHAVAEDAVISAEPDHAYVSRAALKLSHALTTFNIDPSGRICLDVGASTGGFTQVLAEGRAVKIYAVDVGTDQLHPDIRALPQVMSLEQTDARTLSRAIIPDPIDLIVCDASFISATKVLGAALALAAPGAQLITLVKPQFEVGRARIGKGGIVTDPDAHDDAVAIVSDWLAAQGWQVKAKAISPITGGSGNIEFLLWACRSG